MLGQLPIKRVTPDMVFENVGVDYAGLIYIKHGHVLASSPHHTKAYICVFVSLSLKAVHLGLVFNLTSEAFISTSDDSLHDTEKPHLYGAIMDPTLKELAEFLQA